MAYDEKLAERVRALLQGRKSLVEKKMFGGIGFMLRGNMCCGIAREELFIRIAPAEYDAALAKPHTRVFDFSGKPMKGWLVITPPGYKSGANLKRWVDQGVQFALSLPPK